MTSDHHGGVQTRNLFELLEDDEDAPTSTTTKPEEVKKEPKKDSKRINDRDKPTPRVAGGDRRVDGGDRGRGGTRAARGGAGGGDRGGRGRGGGDSGTRERKEYDAHVSRSGKTREPKKEGAGKFNEGSLSDVIADGTTEDRRTRRRDGDIASETKADNAEGSSETPADGGDDSPAQKKPQVEVIPEEPPTQTYDEFLKSKPRVQADLAIKTREVQNDESQFKPVKVHAKSEEKNPYIIASAAEEKEKAPKVKKDKAKHISFDEFIATGDNAGRGGYRGRGGRGRGGRGDSRPPAPAVTDDNFPTLDNKTADKPVDKPADKPADVSPEKSAAKPAEKSAAKPAEKSAAKPVEKSAAKPAEKGPRGKK